VSAIVEFENDRVRVLRDNHSRRERHPPVSRHDRLIIYLRVASYGPREKNKKTFDAKLAT
jgi:hypothetical protein